SAWTWRDVPYSTKRQVTFSPGYTSFLENSVRNRLCSLDLQPSSSAPTEEAHRESASSVTTTIPCLDSWERLVCVAACDLAFLGPDSTPNQKGAFSAHR